MILTQPVPYTAQSSKQTEEAKWQNRYENEPPAMSTSSYYDNEELPVHSSASIYQEKHFNHPHAIHQNAPALHYGEEQFLSCTEDIMLENYNQCRQAGFCPRAPEEFQQQALSAKRTPSPRITSRPIQPNNPHYFRDKDRLAGSKSLPFYTIWSGHDAHPYTRRCPIPAMTVGG